MAACLQPMAQPEADEDQHHPADRGRICADHRPGNRAADDARRIQKRRGLLLPGEFLYKAERFSGSPKMGTEEGSVFWMNEEELVRSDRLSPNFDLYLPLFLEGNYSELFFEWDGKAWQAEPHYFSYE